MHPSLRAVLALTLALPCLAATPAEDLVPAMDIPPNLLIDPVAWTGDPQMFDVVGNLGRVYLRN